MKEYVIMKAFNNNVVLAKDSHGEECILMGKGVGYKVVPGEKALTAKIEKEFSFRDQNQSLQFEHLLKRIDISDFELANEIILLAETELQCQLNDFVLLTLSDHINMMLKRIEKKQYFSTLLEWDIKSIYPEEFAVSLKAVNLLRKRTKLPIPREETAFIAMHIINSRTNLRNLEETMLMTKVIQNILNIITYYYQKKFDTDSFTFQRFVTHIRFFVKRQISGQGDDNDSSLIKFAREQQAEDYNCALKIKDFLLKTYNWNISQSELLYLTLHLNRLNNS